MSIYQKNSKLGAVLNIGHEGQMRISNINRLAATIAVPIRIEIGLKNSK
jgi:hypothetical protein